MRDKLQQAMKLIESGDLDGGRQLLIEKLKADPKNDVAWFWMSKAVDSDDLREECLQEALKHNPRNAQAKQALANLRGRQESPGRQPEPVGLASLDTGLTEAGPESRRGSNLPITLVLVLALAVAVLTYVVVREDLTYRLDGQVARATALELSRDAGSGKSAPTCRVKYQFLAYGSVRQGQSRFPCSEWDRINQSRLLQIEYLVSDLDRNRYYPNQNNFELIAWGGFGLSGLLFILSGFLFVRRFRRKKR